MSRRLALPISAMLAVVMLGCSLGAKAQPASADEVLKLERDLHNRMTVPVLIGSSGPFDFLIDTGSERTVLAREVARKLGLAISGNATVVGVAGSVPVELVEIDEISLGKRTYYTLTAPLLDAQFIGADGIVGIDSLQDQRVLIDFAANRIVIGVTGATGSIYAVRMLEMLRQVADVRAELIAKCHQTARNSRRVSAGSSPVTSASPTRTTSAPARR